MLEETFIYLKWGSEVFSSRWIKNLLTLASEKWFIKISKRASPERMTETSSTGAASSFPQQLATGVSISTSLVGRHSTALFTNNSATWAESILNCFVELLISLNCVISISSNLLGVKEQ